MRKTFLFYDIETSGLNKCFDQVVQFAAIRTNEQFEELERYEYFILLNRDVVPSPEAFITHRLRPSFLNNGLSEIEAIQKIHTILNTPGTISIGYNSLGFDDEFLRFSFYRNLLPPYSHQYANQCSRMDLYPITVMYYLFKRHLLQWPDNNLKLENLSKLNGFISCQAHNAMVDVVASLNLARCLRQDLATWEYLLAFFNKEVDLKRCQDVMSQDAIGILIDGKFGHRQSYQAAVLPLGNHHHYKNQWVWLRLDEGALNRATMDDFINHTWAINKKLGEPAWILPMKERFMKDYLHDQQKTILTQWQWVRENEKMMSQIKNYYLDLTYTKIPNLDLSAGLYENGFLSAHDEEICKQIHKANPKHKVNYLSLFSKLYLKELLIRILGRHYPEVLIGEPKEKFENYCNSLSAENDVTLDYKGQKRLKPQEALIIIEQLLKQSIDDEQRDILKELKVYISNNFNSYSR